MFSSNASQVSAANYIEDVFSTYLYTGNGSTQNISNGIDLSTYGGMVWTKRRNAAGYGNYFIDTARGATKTIDSTSTSAETTYADSLTAFTTTGYTLGADTLNGGFNNSAGTYAGWSFRKQTKFFDVVTYTGDGVAGRTVPHSLGSVPGCIIIKRTDSTANWQVYHRSLANTQYLVFNTTAAVATGATRWNSTTPTSTVFTLGTDATVNGSGFTYVAYLFAHDAGGFGVSGSDNVISCGSFTTDASANATTALGYEPQWIMYKSSSAANSWWVYDVMRGLTVNVGNSYVAANSSGAEGIDSANVFVAPTSTGFINTISANTTYVYIAIRRGPMRLPTSGSDVYAPYTSNTINGLNVSLVGTGGKVLNLDALWVKQGRATTNNIFCTDRLRGASTGTGSYSLVPSSTAAETTSPTMARFTGIPNNTTVTFEQTITSAAMWGFKRAPGFFDVVCYTGTSVARTVSHNLGVAPELMIVKSRSNTRDWTVYSAATGNANALILNTTAASAAATTVWNSTTPTASVFSLGNQINVNATADTYVAYLFATVAGVSKVGSYTGTAALQTINCGFTSGARFVLIKRTDSTGDWYVWDSARGISSGNDPYLLINSTAAEVTGTNYVDTTSVGFQVTAAAPAGINASGGSYIFLAIA